MPVSERWARLTPLPPETGGSALMIDGVNLYLPDHFGHLAMVSVT
jgi:hypothetical protein